MMIDSLTTEARGTQRTGEHARGWIWPDYYPVSPEFACQLREFRIEQGWKQSDLADRLCVSPVLLGLLERGQRPSVSHDTLSNLVRSVVSVRVPLPPAIAAVAEQAGIPVPPYGPAQSAGACQSRPGAAEPHAGRGLRPGDVVMIYEDPMTNRRRLGPARLIRKLVTYSRHQTGWLVEFLAQPGVHLAQWICSDPSGNPRLTPGASSVRPSMAN